MLAIEAQGKEIRTVEGLTQGTVLHPVQQAFVAHDGTMCGFCTPGFVMSAVALLDKHPSPTPEQARPGARRQYLPLRHLHARARSRARSTEGGEPVADPGPGSQAPARPQQHAKYPWPRPDESAVVGKRLTRLDGPDKVTGRAKYTYDINRPGMLHARILRSPHAHARIVSIDLSAAQKAPRREGGAGRARARQEGDVPGRRGRGGGGGDRGAGTRRAAPDQGGVRGAAPRRHRGACAAGGRTGRLRGRQHQGRRGRGERRSRGRLQVSRAHRRGQRTKRRCRRTCVSRRRAASASGRATS